MEDRNLKYAEILAKLIQADTVSESDSHDRTKFLAFHELLRETFPNIFSACSAIACRTPVVDKIIAIATIIKPTENKPIKPLHLNLLMISS